MLFLKVIRYYPGFLYSLLLKPFLIMSLRHQKLSLSEGNAQEKDLCASGIFIVNLSFCLAMINAIAFSEYTVYYFYVLFLCDITNKYFPAVSTSTTHLTSPNQPTNTTTRVTTQPTKTSQTTRSTTASSVTSSQRNITVVTTSKTSFTSVTGEFTFQ